MTLLVDHGEQRERHLPSPTQSLVATGLLALVRHKLRGSTVNGVFVSDQLGTCNIGGARFWDIGGLWASDTESLQKKYPKRYRFKTPIVAPPLKSRPTIIRTIVLFVCWLLFTILLTIIVYCSTAVRLCCIRLYGTNSLDKRTQNKLLIDENSNNNNNRNVHSDRVRIITKYSDVIVSQVKRRTIKTRHNYTQFNQNDSWVVVVHDASQTASCHYFVTECKWHATRWRFVTIRDRKIKLFIDRQWRPERRRPDSRYNIYIYIYIYI